MVDEAKPMVETLGDLVSQGLLGKGFVSFPHGPPHPGYKGHRTFIGTALKGFPGVSMKPAGTVRFLSRCRKCTRPAEAGAHPQVKGGQVSGPQ